MSKKIARIMQARTRRKQRVRKRIKGSAERPRLTVYRSSKHIYAQVIDDISGRTLASASSLSKTIAGEEVESKADVSKLVGKAIADSCREAGVTHVVFDRNGYLYTSGRIRALAEGAREAGLTF